MPKGGRGRGRAKGKGRAQLLADGESLRPARRPAVDKDDDVPSTQPQRFGDIDEKGAHKVPSSKEMVTERKSSTGSLG